MRLNWILHDRRRKKEEERGEGGWVFTDAVLDQNIRSRKPDFYRLFAPLLQLSRERGSEIVNIVKIVLFCLNLNKVADCSEEMLCQMITMNDRLEHWTVGIRCFSLPVEGLPFEELSLKISHMIYVMMNQCPDPSPAGFPLL